ncbi:MAG: hypothetical protein RLZZ15_3413 [Verrucomicrobiota bacterium]|jgi:HlyD family secretion protein
MSANPSRLGLKLLLVLLVLGAAGGVAWLSIQPVAKVAVVRSGTATKIVPGTVVVVPEKTLELKSEADGRLTESAMTPGQVVKAGDILAQVDATDLDIDIKHNQSELAATRSTIAINDAKADLLWKTAEEEFAEVERQHKLKALADVPFEKARREFEGKKEERKLTKVDNDRKIEALENKLETLALQRRRTTVKAQFDGVVDRVFFHAGALIEKKQTLATLITTSRVVVGKISEENFSEIEVGKKALVKFLGYGDATFDAKVVKKMPTAEQDTQRYQIHLDVAIPLERLLPDLTGDVAVKLQERQAETLIPRRALFDGKFVYVVENGRVAKREVELGYTSLTAAEVLKGLRAGDQVIADDRDKFASGDRVRPEIVKW